MTATSLDALNALDVIATGSRPNLVLDMVAAHEVMTALQAHDVRRGGCWLFAANVWQRFDRPWSGPDTPDGAQLVGSIYVTHGAPTAYDATINRVTVTPLGAQTAWTPQGILAEALGLGGLSTTDCGSIDLSAR
jgi:hypothetical protein